HPCAEHLPVLSTAAEIGAGRLRRALPSGTTLRGVVMFLRRQPRPYGTHLSGGCVLWPHDWGLSLILCQSLDFYRSLPESEFLAEAGRFRCLVSVRACSLPQPRRYSGRSTLNCGRRASPETVPASARGVVRPHEAAGLPSPRILPGPRTLSRPRTPRRGAQRGRPVPSPGRARVAVQTLGRSPRTVPPTGAAGLPGRRESMPTAALA